MVKRSIPASISLALITASALGAMAVVSPARAVTGRAASGALHPQAAVLHRPGLVAAYAAARGIPASDVAGVSPGTVHIAYDAATRIYWALAGFLPSARARGAALLGFQDGGSTGVFTRHGHARWRMIGYASQPPACTATVPRRVRRSWGLASSGCGGASRSGPAAGPPRAPSAATAVNPPRIAQVAQEQVGVGDTPASLKFGFDCNPFTTLVGVGAGTSGCGVDPKFNVQNENEEWCSDFTKWVWEQGGVTADLGTLAPASASFYQWALDQGQHPAFDSGVPQIGDAVVFYPAADKAPNTTFANHVGIIVGINSDGTLNLVNGDFMGSSNITVQANNDVSLTSFAAAIWGSGEHWILVSPGGSNLAGGPVVYDPSSGNLEVYGTGTDGALWQRVWNPVYGWSGWLSRGGSITGTPSAVFNPTNGNLEVYAQGTGSSAPLEEKYWSPSGGWHNWQDLGNSIADSPAAIYDPSSGNIEVYATGSDGALWQKVWNPVYGWSGWLSLGGSIAGIPSPVYNPTNGNLEVYALGTGLSLEEKYWSPSGGWHNWQDLGNSIADSPAAIYDPASGNIEVYATGSDGALWQKVWNPVYGWSGWLSLGGSILGNPSPLYDQATGRPEVYVRGGTALFQKYWTASGGWSSWVNLGGPIAGNPAAINDTASGNLDIYALTSTGSVWERYWSPSTGWHTTSLGGSLNGL